MKTILILILTVISSISFADDKTYVFLQNYKADFSKSNEVIPLSEAKDYTFHGNGIGLEKNIFEKDSFSIRGSGSFTQGNYLSMTSVGGVFLNNFSLSSNLKIGIEFNLGFDYLWTSTNSPYKGNQLNFYSKIGPRMTYNFGKQEVVVGIYHYYSALMEDLVLKGWNVSLYFSF
jgi:hypothetical protein